MRLVSFLAASIAFSAPAFAGLTTLTFDEWEDLPYIANPAERVEVYGSSDIDPWRVPTPTYTTNGVTLQQLFPHTDDGFASVNRLVASGLGTDLMNIASLDLGVHGNGLYLAGTPFMIYSDEAIYFESVQLLRFEIDIDAFVRVDAFKAGALIGSSTVQLQPGRQPGRTFSEFSFTSLGAADRFVLTGFANGSAATSLDHLFWVDNLGIRSVPEPGALALMSSGMFLAAFVARRGARRAWAHKERQSSASARQRSKPTYRSDFRCCKQNQQIPL